jgi:hypothetical protein
MNERINFMINTSSVIAVAVVAMGIFVGALVGSTTNSRAG